MAILQQYYGNNMAILWQFKNSDSWWETDPTQNPTEVTQTM
jgi:hypothetical protein